MPASSTWISDSGSGSGVARGNRPRAASSRPLLDARGLSRSFDDKVVLRSMSLRVDAGEVVGLIAPNGSGKSTLLDLIAGVLEPDAGQVHIGGRDVTTELNARRGVFYVPQSVKRYFAMKHPSLYCYVPDLSVRDNLLAQHDGNRFSAALLVDEALSRFGLLDVAGEMPASLSVGMQQRLALARALGSPHAVLLLDEPLASVDRPTRLRLLRELAEGCGERAVIYVTHDLAEIEALGGRLVELEPAEVARPTDAPPPADAPRPAKAARPADSPRPRAPTPGVSAANGPTPPAAPLKTTRAAPPAVPSNGGGAPILTSLPADEPGLARAAAAATLELAGLALQALADPPAGRRGLSAIAGELAERLLREADRKRDAGGRGSDR